MPTLTGLDVLLADGAQRLAGKRVALLCNQASVSKSLEHIVDALLPHHKAGKFEIAAVFGPQHGLHGHTQDNMIEWEGGPDVRTGIPVHSLYGERRKPTDEQLLGVELFVADLQDVGARYYTFVWTFANCMAECERLGIPMLVLDRPNPIGGLQVEGPVMQPEWASFVGLHPMPARHGLTFGELANHLRHSHYPQAKLEVVQIEGWSRSDYYDDLDLRWIPPSPNVPTVDTAAVYPGMCLLEGTNLSEGRGTTRPFETFGAPWLDGWKLAESLHAAGLPGARFRPIEFQPTSQKHAGERCGGCFIHVVDRRSFEPVLAAVSILRECWRQAPDRFAWKEQPYEYETERRPIDLLLGVSGLAETILSGTSLNEIRQTFLQQASAFEANRHAAMLYRTS